MSINLFLMIIVTFNAFPHLTRLVWPKDLVYSSIVAVQIPISFEPRIIAQHSGQYYISKGTFFISLDIAFNP